MNYHGIDIKLVNVKTFVGHDTKTGLNADIVYNGKKILHVYDSAHGGCFEYHLLGDREESRKLQEELEKRIAALPNPEGCSWKQDLDWVVDQVFNHQTEEKEKKDSLMYNKGILFKEDGKQYEIGWPKFTLKKLAKHPKGIATIQAAYLSLKNKKGVEIVNTERLKKIGIEL